MEIHVKNSGMVPILIPGDKILSKKISFNQIKTYDLVVIIKKHVFEITRVIYIGKHCLMVKTDDFRSMSKKAYNNCVFERIYGVVRNGHLLYIENIYMLQSSTYFSEIIKIKGALEKAKINYVFFKGLPLHLYFEKTHPKRIYADYDYNSSMRLFLFRRGYSIQNNTKLYSIT